MTVCPRRLGGWANADGLAARLAPPCLPLALAFLAAGASVRAQKELRLSLAGYGAFSLAGAALTGPPDANRIDRQIPLSSSATIPRGGADLAQSFASGVAYLRLAIVNVAFLVLKDAGDRG